MSLLLRKPKTQRGKRAVVAREPKIFETVKTAMLIRGSTSSNLTNSLLKDLYLIRKPDAVHFTRHNKIMPFEDVTSLEFLSQRNDASLFVVSSHSKKRPHNIILGRMFDYHVLDMIELGITNFKSLQDFKNEKFGVGFKPCFVFNGEVFETKEDYIKLKNLIIDFFRGTVVDNVNLEGLDHAIVVTALPDGTVAFRSYRVIFNRSGLRIPRVELDEVGPSFDMTLRRNKFAEAQLYKEACKIPKAAKKTKEKNIEYAGVGEKHGRIHMQRQDVNTLQTRKMKGLKRNRKGEDADTQDYSEDLGIGATDTPSELSSSKSVQAKKKRSAPSHDEE
eukprot:TRINITY_DN13531_c0_g1_i1.p1 TRINITY_DN13531_c0_g1~~TRINITY_DN13531_c0_g1_i1.p1  ORF type:complete len:333 (-),score=82.15 TRINITY_DN13531_c0_g1_i1:153-1151(-)